MSVRRVFVGRLTPGERVLCSGEARHVRDVLRLEAGDKVEAFDEAGQTAAGRLLRVGKHEVVVAVESIVPAPDARRLIVVSAVPKGDRADWMIEKLSELGVTDLQPVICKRSVVEPGQGKLERWKRIAIEAAKQSQRVGVMRIHPLTEINLVNVLTGSIVLCTHAQPTATLTSDWARVEQLFIGPEGGFVQDETERLISNGASAIRLHVPILRVETAAIVAASLVLCQSARKS